MPVLVEPGAPLKVLLVTNQLDVGGIETNIVRLTAELGRRGHQVTVASRPGALSGRVHAAGGRTLDLEVRPSRPGAVARDARRLRRFLAAEEPDVVHVFSAGAAALMRLATLGTRRHPAVVSSIMGLRVRPDEQPWRVWLRAWATTFGVDRLIVTAPAIQAEVDRLPVRSRRVVRGDVVGINLPDPPPPEVRHRVRVELGTGERPVVLTIGRLDPSKSHELFIRAAARCRADATFVVVGGGTLQDQLEAEVASSGAGKRVLLLGERHDVTALLAATDVYVRPGIVEGFVGITVLEAQALSLPVVSFETEDVKLAIENGRSGVLVPAGDVDALADAVAALLEDPARAAEIGRLGHEKVRARYALGPVVDQLLQNYDEVRTARLKSSARSSAAG
jgi:glycosyltransferase involved in cell wall biosynthesis